MDKELKDLQAQQFQKISKSYDEASDRVGEAISKMMRGHLYSRLSGKKVLDVGNGGLTPNQVFGEEIASSIEFFVGVDASLDMLLRHHDGSYFKVKADGRKLPFKDKAFDHVVLNGVLHHLGYKNTAQSREQLGAFLKELKRVSRGEILVYEIFLPEILEMAEKVFSKIKGSMPTFVLSERTLDSVLRVNHLRRTQIVTKTLSDLTSPFYWYLLILEYPFLKVPALVSPFKHSFFLIDSDF